jgi:hypothetical protein
MLYRQLPCGAHYTDEEFQPFQDPTTLQHGLMMLKYNSIDNIQVQWCVNLPETKYAESALKAASQTHLW